MKIFTMAMLLCKKHQPGFIRMKTWNTKLNP